MQSNKKQKIAARFGVLYFLLVGVVNFGATLFFAKIQAIDIYLLVWSLLPLIISNKVFSATYGVLGGLIASVIVYSCSRNHLVAPITASQFDFMIGYLLGVSMLIASGLLFYGRSPI